MQHPRYVTMIVLLLYGLAVKSQGTAVSLSDSNFEAKTKSTMGNIDGPWFVLFYMPWCGYCKEILPVWESLAGDLAGKVQVAKVDLEKNKKVSHRFRRKIGGYPTMMLLSGGKLHTYTGTRDIILLQEFALGGFREVDQGARAPVPRDPETMMWWETIMEALEDFFLGIKTGYAGIWANYKKEFIAAISTSFSLGGLFGFFMKILIDWMLPPLPKPNRLHESRKNR